MITNPENGVTVEAVNEELTMLENNYRSKRTKLRALLRVLQEESRQRDDADTAETR